MTLTIRMRARTFFVALFASSSLLLNSLMPAEAEDGVTPDTIVFGQATVLEGPASALGQGMRAGIRAAFEEESASRRRKRYDTAAEGVPRA